jgi:hypothetical protein
MQPDRNPTDWQQPKEQPPQAPYATNSLEAPKQVQTAPVVTLNPDQLTQPAMAPIAPVANIPSEQSAMSMEPSLEDGTNEDGDQVRGDNDMGMEPVRWEAREYIHHEKSSVWFIVFAATVVVLIVVAVFLIQSVSFAILIPVMAAALLVYTHRPPRILEYTLSRQGLHINDHLYPFTDFKSFGVIRDGEEYSVMLVPTQRFRIGVSVYFPEEAGEAIVDMLGARLPMQELNLDIIDKLIRKLRI